MLLEESALNFNEDCLSGNHYITLEDRGDPGSHDSIRVRNICNISVNPAYPHFQLS